MSVYYEAVTSGRIARYALTTKPVKVGRPPRSSWYGGSSRLLREVKREEAQQRADVVAFERTKRYRRDLAAELAAAAKRRRDSHA